MTKVHVTDIIDAPADALWKMLYDFGGLEKLLPDMIETCKVEGTGLGATRDIVFKDGGGAFETMSRLDEAGREFDYTLDRSTLPLENYVATVKVSDAGGKAQIDWSSVFDGVGMSEEEAVEFATGLYQTLIGGLKSSLGASSAAAE